MTGTRSIISLGFNQIEQLSKYITDKGWFDTNSLTLLEAPLIQRPRNKVAETPPSYLTASVLEKNGRLMRC